jgi:hypothetical protein
VSPDANLCPPLIAEAIEAYVLFGKPVGGFVRSILENDLYGAVLRADEHNVLAIPHIVTYVVNNVPTAACGSAHNVDTWSERKRRERQAATIATKGEPE